MKINGRKLEGPNVEILVLPRSDGDIVFKAQAVLDNTPFEKLCPQPKPPTMIKRGVGLVEDVESPVYKTELKNYATRRIEWLILESLKATEGLEWDTVNMSDSSTWKNYEKDLKNAGFGQYEINRIEQLVLDVNCLNESKMDEARKRFLLGQVQTQNNSTSQIIEQPNTQSGEHVNGSVSVHQK